MKKSILFLAIFAAIVLSGFRDLGSDTKLYPELEKFFASNKKKFNSISNERSAELAKISQLIAKKKSKGKSPSLVLVSKNNSGSDQLAQTILQAAIAYYGISDVKLYSAGSSASEVDGRIIERLTKTGFKANASGSKTELKFNDMGSVTLFSKKIDDSSLPQSEFYSVVICTEGKTACQASQNSEYVAEIKLPEISDIKDNAEFEKVFSQIAIEMAYVAYELKETHVK